MHVFDIWKSTLTRYATYKNTPTFYTYATTLVGKRNLLEYVLKPIKVSNIIVTKALLNLNIQ